MADRRIYELATKSGALGANDYFAVDNGTEAESKKLPTSYFTDQLADMQNVYGAKNLNKYPYYSTSLTTKGLTFTDLGDGRIKINGTATGTVNYVLQEQAEDSLSLEADADYLGSIEVISGSGSKGSGSQYQFRYEKYHGHTSGGYKDIKFTSSYEEVSINTSNGNTNIGAYFSAYSGNTFTDLIIAPMIRKASIKDTTWVPYAKTNKELTDAFKNQVANIDDEYSPSKPYEVGDRCIYNNVLYKCITACSAAAWSVNQTNFEATTLAESVADLNSALMTRNITQLAITANTTDTQFTIDNINNYDIIVLQLTRNGSDPQRTYGCSMLPVSSFKNTASNKYMCTAQLTSSTNTAVVGLAYYVDDTHVKMRNSDGWGTVLYGIKL